MSNTVYRDTAGGQGAGNTWLRLVACWLWVGVPLAWGILETLRASLAFFG
jgi:hypothetical protein